MLDTGQILTVYSNGDIVPANYVCFFSNHYASLWLQGGKALNLFSDKKKKKLKRKKS